MKAKGMENAIATFTRMDRKAVINEEDDLVILYDRSSVLEIDIERLILFVILGWAWGLIKLVAKTIAKMPETIWSLIASPIIGLMISKRMRWQYMPA